MAKDATNVSKGNGTSSQVATPMESQQKPDEEVKKETSQPDVEVRVDESETEPTDIDGRLDKIEGILKDILKVIDVKDEPVAVLERKNYNPDYLPKTGGKPVDLSQLPPRKG